MPFKGVFHISAGDMITASVNYVAPQFVITVKEVTTSKSFTQRETCDPCQRNTAEVIAEVPGFFPSGRSSIRTGRTSITETSAGITYATVSALNKTTSKAARGSAFVATWKHSRPAGGYSKNTSGHASTAPAAQAMGAMWDRCPR